MCDAYNLEFILKLMLFCEGNRDKIINNEPYGIADSELSSPPEHPPPLLRGQPRVHNPSP